MQTKPVLPSDPSTHLSTILAPDGMRVGHVHLKVADLDRALGFWRDVIGLRVMQARPGQVAFLSAGGYHHHVALNTWESLGGAPPAPGTTGLFHAALVFPDRASLGAVLKRVLGAGIALDGAADHGVSEAIYLRDRDGNGVELYRDRPTADWPLAAGRCGQLGDVQLPARLARPAGRSGQLSAPTRMPLIQG